MLSRVSPTRRGSFLTDTLSGTDWLLFLSVLDPQVQLFLAIITGLKLKIEISSRLFIVPLVLSDGTGIWSRARLCLRVMVSK